MMQYITHARTIEELRQEFLADIHRRIANLEAQKKVFAATSKAGQARFDGRINELTDVLTFWTEITLAASPAKKG